MINVANKGKGGIPDRIDLRNYRMDVAFGADLLPAKLDISDKIKTTRDQDGSGSCGGQAFGYYMEVKSFIRDGAYTKLSSKDLYSPCRISPEGSRSSDLLNRLANHGIAEEADIPSYDNGQPPSETFMSQPIYRTADQDSRAMQYWVDQTYWTFSGSDINQVKQAIYQGSGAVVALLGNNACWTTKDGVIQVPAQGTTDWGHFVYLTGWDDTKKQVKFVNSWGTDWGDKGFGYLPYSYFTGGLVYNEWTVLEYPKDKYSWYMRQITILKNLIELFKKLLNK